MSSGTVSRLNNLSRFESNTQEIDVKLLEGQFNSEQAKQQVLSILGKSIQHHWVQSFKHHEASGKSNFYADTKMRELSKLRDDILSILDKAGADGYILDIQASLKVNVIPSNPSEKIAS